MNRRHLHRREAIEEPGFKVLFLTQEIVLFVYFQQQQRKESNSLPGDGGVDWAGSHSAPGGMSHDNIFKLIPCNSSYTHEAELFSD